MRAGVRHTTRAAGDVSMGLSASAIRGGEVRGEEQGGGQGGHQAWAAQHRPGPGNADDKESNLF